jgi:hypothetical protein
MDVANEGISAVYKIAQVCLSIRITVYHLRHLENYNHASYQAEILRGIRASPRLEPFERHN